MRPTKTCQICGAEFEKRPNLAAGAWEKQRYCSHSCAQRDQKRRRLEEAEGLRKCEYCGRPISRYLISPVNYATRRFCKQECRRAYEAMLTTLDDPTTCECGQPATVTLWVVQFSADGYANTVPLHLCAACAAHEPNGSPEPQEVVDARVCFGWQAGERGYHHAAGWSFRRTHTD